jgi:hypothetical protein
MRELTIQEKKFVFGAQLPTSGTQSYPIPNGGSVTVDWTSVTAGLAEIKTGQSQVNAGNTAQGLSAILSGFNEVLADITVTPAT